MGKSGDGAEQNDEKIDLHGKSSSLITRQQPRPSGVLNIGERPHKG
jgi:hypothetical protein